MNGVYSFNGLDARRLTSVRHLAQSTQPASSRYQLYQPAGGDLDAIAALFTQTEHRPVRAGHLDGQREPDADVRPARRRPLDRRRQRRRSTPRASAGVTAFGNDNTHRRQRPVVQPRFGFNYTFDTERPTQMRGGVGLFQGRAPTVWLGNPFSNTGLDVRPYDCPRLDTGTPTSARRPTRTARRRSRRTVARPPRHAAGRRHSIAGPRPAVGVEGQPRRSTTELPWWGIGVHRPSCVLTSTSRTAIYYQQLNLGAPTGVGRTAA